MIVPTNLTESLLIFGSAFVLEDIAVLGAAALVANQTVSLPWAAASSFAGVWLGDFGLYWLARRYGRPVLDRPWFQRLCGKRLDLDRGERWFREHGTAALLLSRAIPGTRLPTFVSAGLLRLPTRPFIAVTMASCAAWIAGLFAVSMLLGAKFTNHAIAITASLMVAFVLVGRLDFRKLARWEFWPAAIFYIPVAIKYLVLAIRYRSIMQPTAANPGMYSGGLIGESKFDTLAQLARSTPVHVPTTQLIHRGDPVPSGLKYPVVFKPDVGQRGFGFRIIRSEAEARTYLDEFKGDTVIQDYVAGPHEAGIFYFRDPREDRGRIFAITEKVFPEVVGDGLHSVEELIRCNERAAILANTYLRRFASERQRILRPGESLRLVEAGNHCQGAIFLDGRHLNSPLLENRIDEISRSLPGFFVGRYDVRYTSVEALRDRAEFQILELNGASAEATAIYDPRNSLFNAYRTLFRQWEIVFAIGNENRRRGFKPSPVREIVSNWLKYRRDVSLHPVSD
jgi:membrane protein DedA with SNARE-associated domain